MLPLSLGPVEATRHLAPAEEAIARSVLYAGLFDYPLTLSQLRQSLIESRQTATELLTTFRGSVALRSLVEYREGFFFPFGRHDMIAIRRRRESRSRSFLAGHRPLLHLIAALPYVRMMALSGSIAHLNLEAGGDLDLFIVTRGSHVWSTTVMVIVLARLLRRRHTLCANFVVADTALRFEPQDLFTASQIIGLRPLVGAGTFRAILAANPFVHERYPNYHAPDPAGVAVRQPVVVRAVRRTLEAVLAWPSAVLERICRVAYRAYLRRRSATWASPEQVTLGDDMLKLHTRSHRKRVLLEFAEAVGNALTP